MGFISNIASSLASTGYLIVFFAAMAESGLVIGFFLPGDTILIAVGVLASQGYFNLYGMMIVAFLGAVMGDSIAYALGRHFGPRLFKKERSFFFTRAQVERSQHFYARHGGKTIVIARFLPVVRAVAPILAGVGKMRYSTFLLYNIIGGFLWTITLTLAGYYAGSELSNIHNYLGAALWVAAIIILVPLFVQLFLDKDRRLLIKNYAKRIFSRARKQPDK